MNEVDDKSKVFLEVKLPTDAWRDKHVMHWATLDIMQWIIHVAQSEGIDYENIDMKAFRTTGDVLWSMTESDFLKCDPNYGQFLYQALKELKCRNAPYSLYTTNLISKLTPPRDLLLFPEIKREVREVKHYNGSGNSDGESENGDAPKKNTKRPPERRKRDKPTGRLWEFIRDLLLDRRYCPSLICWENYEEGVFRFVQSDQVAKLWGMRKQNTNMTYEKLSRAMRYYYKSRVLEPVLGRRLVYRFGPTATGWHTPDPNFTKPVD